METIQIFDIKRYIQKIDQMEAMLGELKQGLLAREFQESIKRGERDIKEGRVTACKSEKELDKFFASI